MTESGGVRVCGAMLIDRDMVMTSPEVQKALGAYSAAKNSALPGSVPAGVLADGLVQDNDTNLMFNSSATAQQFTNVLNDARENLFMTPPPAANGGDTVAAPSIGAQTACGLWTKLIPDRRGDRAHAVWGQSNWRAVSWELQCNEH